MIDLEGLLRFSVLKVGGDPAITSCLSLFCCVIQKYLLGKAPIVSVTVLDVDSMTVGLCFEGHFSGQDLLFFGGSLKADVTQIGKVVNEYHDCSVSVSDWLALLLSYQIWC